MNYSPFQQRKFKPFDDMTTFTLFSFIHVPPRNPENPRKIPSSQRPKPSKKREYIDENGQDMSASFALSIPSSRLSFFFFFLFLFFLFCCRAGHLHVHGIPISEAESALLWLGTKGKGSGLAILLLGRNTLDFRAGLVIFI